ncbi:MAG: MBOAT family O-acyltransferase [Anaerolineales bacterium]|jgi:D-alanyl-lipoteichoic acid acyltransferase DltB (MBOAT superfamily)
MRFFSLEFLIFISAILLLYWFVKRVEIQNILLVVGSYLFCGWLHPAHAVILGFNTIVAYLTGNGIVRTQRRKKLWFGLGLVLVVGIYSFYKYQNFFIPSLNPESTFFERKILLPLGISFYTLRIISYLVDCYRQEKGVIENFIELSLYIAFFPQLLAGPIDRAGKLIPQIQKPRKWTWGNFFAAWPLLVMGIFKKVFIADNIKIIVDKTFALQEPSKFLLLTGAIGFSLQILADFSGYTDISRGISHLLGFDTSENFNSPYLSLTPNDFWNRWHITLSTWLRDYIFFPVRRFLLRRFRNLSPLITTAVPALITMFISGMWHGEQINFIVWGLYYGVLIVVYQMAGIKVDWGARSIHKSVVAWVVMFSLIVFGWMIFRAPSLDWLVNVLVSQPVLGSNETFLVGIVSLSMTLFYAIPLFIKFVIDLLPRYSQELSGIFYAIATLLIIVYSNSSSPDFIYVQF